MKRSLLLTLLLAGCISGGEDPGIPVEKGVTHGPAVVFDPLRLPIPEIPFPNDLSLRPSTETASGMAWNVSEIQPSEHRSRVRRLLNQLDGFGPFAPIFVSFDGPLDLATVTEDTVMVVNIEPGHPREGERVPLDLGRGQFPLDMRPGSFYGMDPLADQPDLLLPPDNVYDLDGDGTPERVTHYEAATNTLILRPMLPLAQGARHAVIITRGVHGTNARGARAPVRSPFPFKSHAAQAKHVRRGLELAGVSAGDLAFGWTYTTADVVTPMVRLREGVHGRGPLARMAEIAPPRILRIHDTSIEHDADGKTYPEDPRDHRFILQAEFFGRIMQLVSQVQQDPLYAIKFDNVDYFVFGTFQSPDLRTSDHRDIELNTFTGEGEIRAGEVPFLISVPKARKGHQPPFPVMFYFHGTGTSRIESLAFADAAARQGIAVMAFDEVGHGPLIPDLPTLLEKEPGLATKLNLLIGLLAQVLVPHRVAEFTGLPFEEALPKFKEIGLFAELAVHGRNEDMDGDGYADTAEGFFFADPFRQCSSFWQDTVDLMQLAHIVRSLDPAKVPKKAHPNPAQATADELMPYLLAGDFNADGVLDIGGPGVPFSVAGTSLGGFHAVLTAAVEPEITTVSPIAAGGGFADIMLRSTLRNITQRIFLDVFGTVIVGCPDGAGGLVLSQGDDTDQCRKLEDTGFASIEMVPPGTAVVLTNPRNGQTTTTEVNEQGGFSAAVETDRGDEIEVRIGAQRFTVVARFDGAGYARNTTDFRRIVGIQQHVLDRCDPVNFARHLFWEPLPGHLPTNVLFLNAIGDTTVPVSTGVNLALAAGTLGMARDEWEPKLRGLIARGVQQGGDYDVDDLLRDNPVEAPAFGPFAPVKSRNGMSAIRFSDVHGKHEWIGGYERDGFDYGRHSRNQAAVFHGCRGGVVYDEDPKCLQNDDCPLLDSVKALPGCRR